ncbi:MFS transporter [Paraburkholderia sp. J63]|uniref:MFS transporter n=1 Tax=Paraburkholderia sp. J63 TaxID=2805434 RepID=UPI002ABDC07D|nr:MFS transporter [Paraburkholderia sp. J63]
MRWPSFAPGSSQALSLMPERAVVRKVSRRLLGFLFLLYVFSFLDRINIGFAALTMVPDLGLSGVEFGVATALFYAAYIVCGVPGNIMLARLGARRWISAIMIAWGVASTLTFLSRGPASLYVLRVVVGMTEAGFLPGMLLYLTFWFPPAWRARANALFMIAQPVTAAVGSAVSGYVLALDGTVGLKGWQWLFLLEGMPSVLLGMIVFVWLDDSPQHARWLSAAEKRALQAQLTPAAVPVSAASAPRSLVAELLSPAVLRFSVAYFCLVNSLAMIVWMPLIIKTLDGVHGNRSVGMVAAIPQAASIVLMILWGRHSDHTQERRWHLLLPMLAAASGWLIAAAPGHTVLRVTGLCIAVAGSYAAMSIFWTIPDRLLSPQRRAVGIAAINAIGNLGSALNPLAVGWLRDYTHSFAAGLTFAALLLACGAGFALWTPARNEPEILAYDTSTNADTQ